MSAKGELTRRNIIEKSLQLFSVKGYFNTSISDILHATGLTKGGLYCHFKSKEDVWRAVYSDAVGWLLARKSNVPEQEYQPSGPGPWRDLAMARNNEWAGNSELVMYYARKVRELMPWHKDACNLLAESYRRQGKQSQAATVIADCRSYFPSAYLH